MTPYVQNNVFINSQSLQNVSLKEGQSVFVRVLSDNGQGQYTVSFANSRFNVSCQSKLSLGQSFNATVHLAKDGKILLEPFTRAQFAANASGLQGSPGASYESFAGAQNFSSLYNMLSAEGFVPDELSAKLFLFLQQTGVRIDRSLMAKARSVALRFPGRERHAAEAAALLMEDGIEASDSNVKKVLDLFCGDFPFGQEGGQGGKSFSQEENGKEDDEGSKSSAKDENFLKKIYRGSCGSKAGFLTYLNQVKASDNHWIFLPYEWQLGESVYKGIIRILLNLSEKSTKKIEINFKNTVANYDFVLYFSGSKVKEVRFCTLPPLLPSEVKTEELRLGGILSSGMNLKEPVTVTYSDSACIDGICATNEVPSFVEEEI
ncbi:MAG: hypothetical protein J5817_11090 [Treponema sp.]|nr:hypothetical protein [Treponema sp.]